MEDLTEVVLLTKFAWVLLFEGLRLPLLRLTPVFVLGLLRWPNFSGLASLSEILEKLLILWPYLNGVIPPGVFVGDMSDWDLPVMIWVFIDRNALLGDLLGDSGEGGGSVRSTSGQ